MACNQNSEESHKNYEFPSNTNQIECKKYQKIENNLCMDTEKFCQSQGGKKLGTDGKCEETLDYCRSNGMDYDATLSECVSSENSYVGEAEEQEDPGEMEKPEEKEEAGDTETQNKKENYEFELTDHYTLFPSETRSSKLMGKINTKLNRKCFLSRVAFSGHVRSGYLRNNARRIDAFENKHAYCDILVNNSELELKAKHRSGFGKAHCEATCATWDVPFDKTIFSSSNFSVKSEQQIDDLRIGDDTHPIHLCGLRKVYAEEINTKENPGKCETRFSADSLKLFSESKAECKASCISFSDESGIKSTSVFEVNGLDEGVSEKQIELVSADKGMCVLTTVEIRKVFMQDEDTSCQLFKDSETWNLKANNALCAAQCIVAD